jgi:hypothetical protein
MPNKYNLDKIKPGKSKYFPLDIYDKIRMACHFAGKRHGCTYTTQKMTDKIKVTRV